MIYLTKIDPERNMRRYYRVMVQATVLGEWCLVRASLRQAQGPRRWLSLSKPRPWSALMKMRPIVPRSAWWRARSAAGMSLADDPSYTNRFVYDLCRFLINKMRGCFPGNSPSFCLSGLASHPDWGLLAFTPFVWGGCPVEPDPPPRRPNYRRHKSV